MTNCHCCPNDDWLTRDYRRINEAKIQRHIDKHVFNNVLYYNHHHMSHRPHNHHGDDDNDSARLNQPHFCLGKWLHADLMMWRALADYCFSLFPTWFCSYSSISRPHVKDEHPIGRTWLFMSSACTSCPQACTSASKILTTIKQLQLYLVNVPLGGLDYLRLQLANCLHAYSFASKVLAIHQWLQVYSYFTTFIICNHHQYWVSTFFSFLFHSNKRILLMSDQSSSQSMLSL